MIKRLKLEIQDPMAVKDFLWKVSGLCGLDYSLVRFETFIYGVDEPMASKISNTEISYDPVYIDDIEVHFKDNFFAVSVSMPKGLDLESYLSKIYSVCGLKIVEI